MSRVDVLAVEAATGARRLTHAELQEVLAHVPQAGFDPRPDKRGRTNAGARYRFLYATKRQYLRWLRRRS